MMEGTGDLEAALALASERARIKMWTHISQRHDRRGQDRTGACHDHTRRKKACLSSG